MKLRKIFAFASAFFIVLLLGVQVALSFPPERPHDPRPLMEKVRARVKEPKYMFVVMGDSRLDEHYRQTARFVDSLKPDFIIHTGDMVSMGGIGAQWDTFEEQNGGLLDKYPFWPCLSGHDIIFRPKSGPTVIDRANYWTFFGLPQEFHYYFDFQNARFISLADEYTGLKDSEGIKQIQRTDEETEFAWLKKVLADAKGKLIFVWQHRPYYTVGRKSYGGVPNKPTRWTKLFTAHRVKVVFQGHDHIYYRTQRDGVYYITSAGAGARIYGLYRTFEALPDDVYYGGVPLPVSEEDRKSGKFPKGPQTEWRLYNPHLKTDKRYKERQHFVVKVEVDHARVVVSTLSVNHELWDRFVITSARE